MSNRSRSFGNPGGMLSSLSGAAPQIIQAMQRKGQAGFGGVNRMMQPPFNPQTQNLDIPKDYFQRNELKRHFFRTNPIVGGACELHAEFPMSDFHLSHEDPAIEEFLNDILQESNFYEHLLIAAMEYWVIGEFNMFSFFDDIDNPSCYTGFALLDPNKLVIASNNFIQGPQREVCQLRFDAGFRKIIDDGPRNQLTGTICQHLPQDMVAYCKADLPMPLSPLQVSRVKRGNNLVVRGESILERVFPLLMLKDELRSMQRAIARRNINPIELWKIGETNDPADWEEIQMFQETLQATYFDIGSALVWHHAINCQVIGANERMPTLWPEFDAIDNETCTGLLINKGLILGDSSTFASDVVRLDILINRYMLFRTKIEQWILNDIIAPILKIHEIYVPESKVKSMRYREMCGKGRPLSYPAIRWDKQSLRDENAKLDLLSKLVEKKLVPQSDLLRLLNIDPLAAAQKVEDEAVAAIERRIALKKRLEDKGIAITPEFAQMLGFTGDAGAPGAPGPDGGMPSSFSGSDISPSSGMDASLPEVVPGAAPGAGGATSAIPSQPGVQGAPSESQMPVGLPT